MPYRNKPHPKLLGAPKNHVYWGQTTVPMEEIIDDCTAYLGGTPIPKAERKLCQLSTYVRYLVGEVHRLNNALPPEHREDLCPMCGQRTWSRPHRNEAGFDDDPDWHDYTLRECGTCHHIRPEPEE